MNTDRSSNDNTRQLGHLAKLLGLMVVVVLGVGFYRSCSAPPKITTETTAEVACAGWPVEMARKPDAFDRFVAPSWSAILDANYRAALDVTPLAQSADPDTLRLELVLQLRAWEEFARTLLLAADISEKVFERYVVLRLSRPDITAASRDSLAVLRAIHAVRSGEFDRLPGTPTVRGRERLDVYLQGIQSSSPWNGVVNFLRQVQQTRLTDGALPATRRWVHHLSAYADALAQLGCAAPGEAERRVRYLQQLYEPGTEPTISSWIQGIGPSRYDFRPGDCSDAAAATTVDDPAYPASANNTLETFEFSFYPVLADLAVTKVMAFTDLPLPLPFYQVALQQQVHPALGQKSACELKGQLEAFQQQNDETIGAATQDSLVFSDYLRLEDLLETLGAWCNATPGECPASSEQWQDRLQRFNQDEQACYVQLEALHASSGDSKADDISELARSRGFYSGSSRRSFLLPFDEPQCVATLTGETLYDALMLWNGYNRGEATRWRTDPVRLLLIKKQLEFGRYDEAAAEAQQLAAQNELFFPIAELLSHITSLVANGNGAPAQ